MSTDRPAGTQAGLTALLMLAFIFIACPLAAQTQNLFSPLAVKRLALSDQADETVIRSRAVTVAFPLLDSARKTVQDVLRLNVFDDVVVDGIVTGSTVRSPSSYTLTGTLAGEPSGTFIIAVNDDVVMGNIRRADGTHYQVMYAPDGIHETREIDDSKFPPCAVPPPPADAGPTPGGSAAQGTAPDSSDRFDVLVVYTAAAKTAAGGQTAMENLINLAIDETNQAYNFSSINSRVRLVHQEEISYTEVDFSTDLGRLSSTGDGYMDDVHTLRNTYGADLVALISNTTGACGIGYLMTSLSAGFAVSAFSVTRYSCATGNYTFGHEMGHNMGCHHAVGDSSNAQGDGLYNFSNGWRFTAANDSVQYRTIMAYSPGTRIQFFSNPNITYQGTATGSPLGASDEAHNARSINLAAETIANWRETTVSTTTTSIYTATGSNVRTSPFMLAAELNGDATTDIVYLDLKGYIYYTTNRSTWTRIGTSRFTKIVSGDFDGDGNERELAGINLNGYILYTTDLSNWTKIGANKFTNLAGGDFSSSGSNRHLAGINQNGYILYTTDLSNWTKIGENKFANLITCDLGSSGRKKDIAAINLNDYILYSTDISNWTKIGDNKFQRLAAGDFTASGFEKDLAAINLNSYVMYTTDITSWSKTGANRFYTAVSADLDGDGNRDDLAGINLNNYMLYSTDLTNWTRIGSNKFSSITSGDFDGDGDSDDLAGTNLSQHVLYTTNLNSWTKISKPSE